MAEGDSTETLRVDKWLHHVRIFKTRNLAAQACEKTNVRIAGQGVKASRVIRPGVLLEVERGEVTLTLRVVSCPPRRLSAPAAAQCVEDLTAPEVYEKAAALRKERAYQTPRPHEQLAKPNKQQMRQLRQWLGQTEEGGI